MLCIFLVYQQPAKIFRTTNLPQDASKDGFLVFFFTELELTSICDIRLETV